MIEYLIYLICGYFRITVSVKFKESVVNWLFKSKIKYRSLTLSENNTVSFEILSFTKRKVSDFLKKEAIPYSETSLKGAPAFFIKYRHRHGIIIGIVMFCALVHISQSYVWYMDVKGCENVSPDDVIDNLEALGFTYGTNYRKIDFDYLRHNYLASNDDLSWISVNMQGTFAHIEVRELKDPPEKITEGCANIVASENGEIVLLECFEGAPSVSIGDRVAKGELLISGIMTSGEDTLRYERAEGRVLARVSRKFKAVIPKFKCNKIYSGRDSIEREIIFFKKSVKVLGNCRISGTEYDTIIEKVQFRLFDTLELPIFLHKKVHKPYVTEYVPLSEADIYEAKKKLVSERTNEILADAELVDIETHEFENDKEIVIIGTVSCITDIGEPSEVSISD